MAATTSNHVWTLYDPEGMPEGFQFYPACYEYEVARARDKVRKAYARKNPPACGTSLRGWAKCVTLPRTGNERRYYQLPGYAASRSDAEWERVMGRKWDKQYSEQFAYTGSRKADKEILASVAPRNFWTGRAAA